MRTKVQAALIVTCVVGVMAVAAPASASTVTLENSLGPLKPGAQVTFRDEEYTFKYVGNPITCDFEFSTEIWDHGSGVATLIPIAETVNFGSACGIFGGVSYPSNAELLGVPLELTGGPIAFDFELDLHTPGVAFNCRYLAETEMVIGETGEELLTFGTYHMTKSYGGDYCFLGTTVGEFSLEDEEGNPVSVVVEG